MYGGRGAFQSRQSQRQTVVQPPSPPLGPIISTLGIEDLTDCPQLEESSAAICGFKEVASYDWVDETGPTILVPGLQLPGYFLVRHERLTAPKGKPPAWTPLSVATKLKEDKGQFFRDVNAARYPAHPMEAAVQATLTAQADIDPGSVDLFACSSTLGNLLRFIRQTDQSFRILVEVVGKTVFFVRRENSPRELIPDVRGFGHTFPEAYTTWEADVKNSLSHQRISNYRFGELNLMVRSEADGYRKELAPQTPDASQMPKGLEDRGLEDRLASALSDNKIAESLPFSTVPLTVRSGGQRIPQAAVFDLKTRSFRKKGEDTLAAELPRLWIAQIPHFILAYHQWGEFKDIRVQDVRDDVKVWERNNEETLHRFGLLLRKIIASVKGTESQKAELRRKTIDVLELREQQGIGCTLSAATQDQWTGKGLEGQSFLDTHTTEEDDHSDHSSAW